MKVWLIADTHFNHDKIVEYESRPENFGERIILNCQRLIGDDDLVIHLGDVIIGRTQELASIMACMPGTWLLVRGNHDNEGVAWYRKRGFAAVVDSFTLGGVYFTHIPADALPDGCYVNVHGHLHGDGHRKESYTPRDFHQLLAIEHTNYQPVDLYRWVRQKTQKAQRNGPERGSLIGGNTMKELIEAFAKVSEKIGVTAVRSTHSPQDIWGLGWDGEYEPLGPDENDIENAGAIILILDAIGKVSIDYELSFSKSNNAHLFEVWWPDPKFIGGQKSVSEWHKTRIEAVLWAAIEVCEGMECWATKTGTPMSSMQEETQT